MESDVANIKIGNPIKQQKDYHESTMQSASFYVIYNCGKP